MNSIEFKLVDDDVFTESQLELIDSLSKNFSINELTAMTRGFAKDPKISDDSFRLFCSALVLSIVD